jgi:hypothetical protein
MEVLIFVLVSLLLLVNVANFVINVKLYRNARAKDRHL